MDLRDHERNNPNCKACWSGYPKRCQCGGLIHAKFGDYTSRDSYYLEYLCDNEDCDRTEEVEERSESNEQI